MTKSFLPSRFNRIPSKPEFIELTAILAGKLVLTSTSIANPVAKIIAVRFVFLRN
jgi:hypothetical protein